MCFCVEEMRRQRCFDEKDMIDLMGGDAKTYESFRAFCDRELVAILDRETKPLAGYKLPPKLPANGGFLSSSFRVGGWSNHMEDSSDESDEDEDDLDLRLSSSQRLRSRSLPVARSPSLPSHMGYAFRS